MGYVAKAALVIARTQDGGYVHLYDGQPVPGNADPKDVERLADEGFLAEADSPSEAVETPEASGAIKPAGNSSHEAWATYAVQSGQATEDEVRNLTRDELRELYG